MNARDQMLHRLWTRAVGMPGYDKAEWKALVYLVRGDPQAPIEPRMAEAIDNLDVPIAVLDERRRIERRLKGGPA